MARTRARTGELDPEGDLRLLVGVLPDTLQAALVQEGTGQLLEVVLDLGRVPEARFPDRAVPLADEPVRADDLAAVQSRLGEFGGDNRAGIERTLHRISAIRNRRGAVVGLTLRVGRAIPGGIDAIRDLVESGKNLLLLGRPGVGKTTKLREVARVLADDAGKRVMVIDTSNEIGGDGDVPHPAIGGARRMQVPHPARQHDVMIEAVENHMPEVIVIDEIGTEAEALAARTIAERGVQLIGTAHGNTLENLILNPTLSDLVGGVATVTLSDEEAHRRGTPKTIRERRAPPTFDVVVEMVDRDEMLVHRDTAEAVDRTLAGNEVRGERRKRGEQGRVEVEEVRFATAPIPAPAPEPVPGRRGPTRIYAHAVSRDLVERVLRDLPVEARVVDRPERAEVILAMKSRSGDPRIRRALEGGRAVVHAVKRNSSSELRRVLRNALFVMEGTEKERVREAVLEAEHAIQRVLGENVAVPLAPRPSGLRRLQHRMVSRYHLAAESIGSEPRRHLVIYPPAEDGRWEESPEP